MVIIIMIPMTMAMSMMMRSLLLLLLLIKSHPVRNPKQLKQQVIIRTLYSYPYS